MIKASGKILVQKNKGRIALNLSPDFSNYYIWFIQRHFKIKVGAPLHGPHVSLALPQFDKNVNWKKAKNYQSEKVDIFYQPDIIVGGKTKGWFRNFYINFESDELKAICWDVNTEKSGTIFHITLANNKNMGFRDFWPKMIKIEENE